MQNQNYFPWEETKEDNVFPTMIGHFRVKSVEDGQSNSTGKRMFKAAFECVAPIELQGMSHFENYVVGSDEAPMSIIPGSMGTRSFKNLCKAAQVPPNNDIAVLLQSLTNSDLLLSIVEYAETQEGQWKGMKRNRVTGYFRIGEREVGIAPVAGAGGGMKGPAMGAPAPMMAPPAMPAQPAPVAPAAPMVPPQPPAMPVVPPVQQMAPPVQQAPAAGPMLRCPMPNCQLKDVPAADFTAHLMRHQADPAWNGIG